MFKDGRFYVAVAVTSLVTLVLAMKVLVKIPTIGSLFMPPRPPSA